MAIAHPWQVLRGMPELRVEWSKDDELLQGADAWWYPDEDLIVMDSRTKQVVRRCALAHEIAHRERGDFACGGRTAERQELAADRRAASWLIDLNRLADVLAWTTCEVEAASEMWVTLHLLRTRLENLQPAERLVLDRRLGHR